MNKQKGKPVLGFIIIIVLIILITSILFKHETKKEKKEETNKVLKVKNTDKFDMEIYHKKQEIFNSKVRNLTTLNGIELSKNQIEIIVGNLNSLYWKESNELKSNDDIDIFFKDLGLDNENRFNITVTKGLVQRLDSTGDSTTLHSYISTHQQLQEMKNNLK